MYHNCLIVSFFIISSKDSARGIQWEQKIPIRLWNNDQSKFHKVYNRPVYIQKGLSGEPYDMRLYNILKKERSSQPSMQPSSLPSISNLPTLIPSKSPSSQPPTRPINTILNPGTGASPTVETEDSEEGKENKPTVAPTTVSPTKALHSQNEYDTAPDFADWDDFFESPHMHDLEHVLEDYSVVISYSGSRFYGTIIEPDATLDGLFPSDYHAFWNQTFDMNRTFIISDTTFTSTPIGIDFFEMRRRINSMLNPNIMFSYGPFGALIPLMDYQGAGFFHCLDEATHTIGLPSPPLSPTPKPSEYTSASPIGCYPFRCNGN